MWIRSLVENWLIIVKLYQFCRHLSTEKFSLTNVSTRIEQWRRAIRRRIFDNPIWSTDSLTDYILRRRLRSNRNILKVRIWIVFCRPFYFLSTLRRTFCRPSFSTILWPRVTLLMWRFFCYVDVTVTLLAFCPTAKK
jgi:hypothetical protein